MDGIEPSYSGSKPDTLPLGYTPIVFAYDGNPNPPTSTAAASITFSFSTFIDRMQLDINQRFGTP